MDDGVDNSQTEFASSSHLLQRMLPFSDFFEASKDVVHYVRRLTGFQFCAVTRLEQGDIVVLTLEGDGLGLKPGDSLNLGDEFCSQVLEGRFSTVVTNVPGATDGWYIPGMKPPNKVGAYIGSPLVLSDKSLFGTLCALDLNPMPQLSLSQIKTLEIVARMLSTILTLELQSLSQRRSYERAKVESERDELTNLLNRRGWDRALLEEEARCSQYGFTASILVIDLDNLKEVNDSEGHRIGDELIRKTAQVIQQACRSGDVVARTGGDEFAVLTKGSSLEGLQAFARRIRIALMVSGISASVGTSSRTSTRSLLDAWTEADKAMYISKRSKG